ncbi:BPTI/Kunitz domain-containing protein-like [Python bivittatus]|uniref:BPTI/Kunitz domain-containing protein-like n=1 Tax=Python bivittatus TaxID=176946 RepID=A0A9F5J9Q7_PYTBI|nr:BPTI/Kunitz domain-containing protein-like [Python bivittatus]
MGDLSSSPTLGTEPARRLGPVPPSQAQEGDGRASALPETGTCGDACDDDRDCPPRQKCCLTGCRRECTELEQGLCSLPKDPGSCASRLDIFYYDATTATCEAFKYSGCKGNANRFYTKAECLQVCRRLDVCQLLVDPGPCSAHHPRFYYNPQNKTCEKFTYGGCGGNGNRFETQMECIWKCRNPGKSKNRLAGGDPLRLGS